jgi:hypothetical protein
LSERTENRETEDEQMSPTSEREVEERYEEDSEWIESESETDWDAVEEGEELPPRRRSRLLAPLPIALTAVLIAAVGFLAGVLVQQGSGAGASGAAIPGAGGELPSFLAEKGGGGSGAGAGLPTGGAGVNAVTGTVTSVKGATVYVKEAEGNTVAVRAEDGSTVTRDSEVSAKAIHPGDTVVVEGSKKGSTVKASSIAATEAGLQSSSVGGFPAGEAEEGGGPSVQSLFGE